MSEVLDRASFLCKIGVDSQSALSLLPFDKLLVLLALVLAWGLNNYQAVVLFDQMLYDLANQHELCCDLLSGVEGFPAALYNCFAASTTCVIIHQSSTNLSRKCNSIHPTICWCSYPDDNTVLQRGWHNIISGDRYEGHDATTNMHGVVLV